MSLGVPIKVFHEAEGHIVTIELKNGEVYRGTLAAVEDNMNAQLSGVTRTSRDGRVSHLDYAFVRGSHVRFVIMPDMLTKAPMFDNIDSTKARGFGTNDDDDMGGRGGRGGGGRGFGRGRGRGRGGRGRGRGR